MNFVTNIIQEERGIISMSIDINNKWKCDLAYTSHSIYQSLYLYKIRRENVSTTHMGLMSLMWAKPSNGGY